MVEILKRTYWRSHRLQFMHINDAEQKDWLQRRIEGPVRGDRVHPEGKRADPEQADRGRGLREVRGVRFLGHRRFGLDGGEIHDPGAGADHQARRPARREGDRARHEPSRAAERARQCDVQALPPAVPRIPGRQRQSERGAGFGRREVPSRRLVGPRVRRRQGPHVADTEFLSHLEAARSRRARRARPKRQYQLDDQPGARRAFTAAAHPWRRGVRCGQGVVAGVLRDVGHARLQYRRHDPFHQQPGSALRRSADLFALLALPVRRRADGAGADLPCEWRRSRGGRPRIADRDRVPAAVQEGRRHRHVLLSPLRP